MNPLSNDERRALALLAALLILAAAARWLERPRSILDGADDVDLATLEDDSRAAKGARPPAGPGRGATPAKADSTRTPAPATSPGNDAGPAPIDLNTAAAPDLERISGIGPAIARRLLARRDSLGRFRSWDDVDSVRGVGPALLARIRAGAVLR